MLSSVSLQPGGISEQVWPRPRGVAWAKASRVQSPSWWLERGVWGGRGVPCAQSMTCMFPGSSFRGLVRYVGSGPGCLTLNPSWTSQLGGCVTLGTLSVSLCLSSCL